MIFEARDITYVRQGVSLFFLDIGLEMCVNVLFLLERGCGGKIQSIRVFSRGFFRAYRCEEDARQI